jgi:hypothetical protein
MIESFWEQNRTDIGKQFLGTIHRVSSEGNKFFFYDLNACLMAEVISENIIRIRLAPNGHFLPDFSYALQDFPFQPVEVDFEEADTYYEISTPLTICRITKEGFYVSFHNAEGVLLNADGFAIAAFDGSRLTAARLTSRSGLAAARLTSRSSSGFAVATLLLVAEETAVAALLLVGKQTAVAAGTAMAAVASNGTRVTADEGDGNESNEHSETESENTLHHIPPDGNIERGVRS